MCSYVSLIGMIIAIYLLSVSTCSLMMYYCNIIITLVYFAQSCSLDVVSERNVDFASPDGSIFFTRLRNAGLHSITWVKLMSARERRWTGHQIACPRGDQNALPKITTNASVATKNKSTTAPSINQRLR